MTNLYLISDEGATCPKPSQGCASSNLAFKGRQEKTSHLNNNVFNDDPKKCFENAINKNAFTGHRVTDRYDYIMYMCSDSEYDYFKTKITKTKYKVKR